MTSEVFANSPTPGVVAPVATLAGNGGQVSSTATSFSISAALPAVLQSGGQFHALIDHEVVIIPTQAGTALVGVSRGVEGSSPAVHLDGALVYPLLTAGALQNALAGAQAAAEAASASTGALASETSRAESAESSNATAINNETSRAENAETTNANSISSETSRAKAAEAAAVQASTLGQPGGPAKLGTDGTVGGPSGSPLASSVVNATALSAANPEPLVFGTVTRDPTTGTVTSAPVVWPDGTHGTYTATLDSTWKGAVSSYTITYGTSPVIHTYTQPAMTRDPSTGAVTTRPAITVS